MLGKRVQIAVSLGLALVVGLVIFQGCGEITGEFYLNQPPTVEIVNVPKDAYGVSIIEQYKMPFQVATYDSAVPILWMEGAAMVRESEIVYAVDPLDPFAPEEDYHMAYDTALAFKDQYGSWYTDTVAAALSAIEGGGILPDSTYFIDFEFEIDNYYVFTYAPTIHWVGYDPDGFVDHYLYADVLDTVFIHGFRYAEDPELYFAQHEDELEWVETNAMQDTVYLLTAVGDTTEHLFFIKAVDNLGAESVELEFRTFYRSNNPPNNPEIKPIDRPDGEFTLNYVVVDTLFCLDELTPLWEGISFNWTADDPDDMELYQIPLEYSYYLVKTPGDTIWAWSDSSWSEVSQIQLFDLETGSYTFSVWARDDGLSLCSQPATITFNVVQPTFEYHILLINETAKPGGLWDVQPADSVAAFYVNLLEALEGQLAHENYIMDGTDVRLLDNSNPTPAQKNSPIPYSLIGQYQLAIIFDDDHSAADATTYIPRRNTVLARYLDIGGKVWLIGRRMLGGSYGYPNAEQDINSVGTQPRILSEYFQLLTGFVSNRQDLNQRAEFLGAVPVIGGIPELTVDSLRVGMINDPQMADSTTLMEVDWFTRTEDAVTLYTFNSSTADTSITSPNVIDSSAQVMPGATPTQCWITPAHYPLVEVRQVENITKGIAAEIEDFNAEQIRVSYPYGEPWSVGDMIVVDYQYDPISEMHLKPVAVRYEAQPRVLTLVDLGGGVTISYYTYILGYRTAIFAFPLFFMRNENGEVEDIAREMLNWFFYPTVHWEL